MRSARRPRRSSELRALRRAQQTRSPSIGLTAIAAGVAAASVAWKVRATCALNAPLNRTPDKKSGAHSESWQSALEHFQQHENDEAMLAAVVLSRAELLKTRKQLLDA